LGDFAAVYAKTDELTKMPFCGLTHVAQKKHVLDGHQGRTNPFAAARGGKMAMRRFFRIV